MPIRAAFGFRERSGDILLVCVGLIALFTPAYFYLIRYYLTRKSFSSRAGGYVKTAQRIYDVLLICLTLTVPIAFVQLLMSVYSNDIVANFNDTLAVATPYISSEQKSVYLARFAKVRTRSDFITLFGDLNSVLEKNHEPQSDFSPW